jgi:hypothetical protein
VAKGGGDRALEILIPIYKTEFAPIEQFSIDYSLAMTPTRTHCFVAPEGLDCSYYLARYPKVRYEFFPAEYFMSVASYSRLLLGSDFYRRFLAREFILILQPDAIVLRDDLAAWMARPYDYIGAPWPDGIEFTVRRDRFRGELNRRIRTHVGNGGFSLRRTRKCLALLTEFPEMAGVFLETGTNEDAFFSLMGTLSGDFVLPHEVAASHFAMELRPEYYYAVNGNRYPTGVHAWSVVNPTFWGPCIPPLAAVL